MYLLVLGAGYALNQGWVQLPVVEQRPTPIFDEATFIAGIKQIGVVAFMDKLVPVEGKALTDIRVHGSAYNPATRSLIVWSSATARGAYFVFTSDCRIAEAGGWFCTRPVDAGGYVRVN
jgi:hypothetical protein